jgi:hypothetical protein
MQFAIIQTWDVCALVFQPRLTTCRAASARTRILVGTALPRPMCCTHRRTTASNVADAWSAGMAHVDVYVPSLSLSLALLVAPQLCVYVSKLRRQLEPCYDDEQHRQHLEESARQLRPTVSYRKDIAPLTRGLVGLTSKIATDAGVLPAQMPTTSHRSGSDGSPMISCNDDSS